MTLNSIEERIEEVFNQSTTKGKLIIFYPDSQFRNGYITHLIGTHTNEQPVFYLSLNRNDFSILTYLRKLVQIISQSYPAFGHHTYAALPEATYQTEKLLIAFSEDLKLIQAGKAVLIIDEFDLSTIETDNFIIRLVDFLPPNWMVIINGRVIPALPILGLLAKGNTILLKDDVIVQQDFYRTSTKPIKSFEANGFGAGMILVNNKIIENWEGHLPRLLLFYALDRPEITREEACQALWPDLNVEQAVNVFHVTKRRLHKALGVDVLIHSENRYRINPEIEINYDVEEFISAILQGRMSKESEQCQKAWQKAITLHTSHNFLYTHNDAWVVERRKDFQTGYLEAITSLAALRATDGKIDQALALLIQGTEVDATREDIHRKIMELYVEAGRRSEAAAYFNHLSKSYTQNTHQPLSAETLQFYDEIMKQ